MDRPDLFVDKLDGGVFPPNWKLIILTSSKNRIRFADISSSAARYYVANSVACREYLARAIGGKGGQVFEIFQWSSGFFKVTRGSSGVNQRSF